MRNPQPNSQKLIKKNDPYYSIKVAMYVIREWDICAETPPHSRGIDYSPSFGLGRHRQRGAKDVVPKLGGDSVAKLVVEEVVSKVVLLQLLVPQG